MSRSRRNVKPGYRVGHGYDLHRLEAGRPMVLGGVQIANSDAGPVAHSDGDAVLHAVTDAVLGALALEDLGSRYPNSDPQWADAESSQFVLAAVEAVHAKDWVVANADVTVLLERPRLIEHREAMRASLARLLSCRDDRVNVKGKTGEGVGPVGRGEAVECHAVVQLMSVRDGLD
jgi:2-C-methyl-D-erythritol 2,4-cyclodiphosphate synthase